MTTSTTAAVPAAPAGTTPFHVLAVDLGGTKVALATTDPDGTVLHRTTLPTLADQGAGQVMRRVGEAGRALVARTAAEGHGPLRAVAAVSPGIVWEDRILLAPNNPGWERLALPATLRAAFGTDTVAVETDVKAAALAEARWGALAGSDCGIFLNLGTGLSAAPVIHGRVLDGAHRAAGEIGSQLLGVADLAGLGDGRAPLEQHVSGRALADRGSALLGRAVTTAEVFALAGHDPAVAQLVDEALDTLGVHLANLAIALDPDTVAVGGGLTRSADRVLPRLRHILDRAVPFPPSLVPARFTETAPLTGAVLLALDAAAGQRGGASTPSCGKVVTGP
ncbi:ROK family protein [Streptomyces sp. NPDC059740]|uniref:ROK family protein n=1 Tax=Streptomyces sp. NPDC059740 TaxID=3346926 RepID=UPI00365B4505